MAKEEKGTEDFQTLDNAFQVEEGSTESQQDKVVETPETETDTVKDIATDTSETKVADTETGDTETEESGTATDETTAKTWKDFGLDRFDGKSIEEIATEIKWRNEIQGRQSNELGELRAKVEALKKPKEEKGKTDVLAQLPEMTRGEIVDFNEIWENDPRKAIAKYASPYIQQTVKDMLQEAFKGELGQTVQGALEQKSTDIELTTFLQTHEDGEAYIPSMQKLDATEYLGEQRRSLNELYELAKLGSKKDPLYTPIYQMMKSQPSMPLAEAKEVSDLKLSSTTVAQDKLKKAKETVKAIDSVNATTTKKTASEKTTVAATVDEAFDSVEDTD